MDRPADGLGAERSLIDQARSALARGQPEQSLTALHEHETRFPDGQLVEERLALSVLALHAKGDEAQARAQATEFRRRFPKGLFRGAVDATIPP